MVQLQVFIPTKQELIQQLPCLHGKQTTDDQEPSQFLWTWLLIVVRRRTVGGSQMALVTATKNSLQLFDIRNVG